MSEFKRPGTPPGFERPETSTDLDRNVTPLESPKVPGAPVAPLAPPPRPKGGTGAVAALPPTPTL
ncbi:MAG TPA: ATPase, partial [Hyalangium sp.]|nr:ATPase [Hyalangium sp.]